MTNHRTIPPADPAWTRLTAAGHPVLGMHARLASLIAAKAGPGAAGLLATPVLDADGKPTGWASTSGAPLRPPADDAERARLVETLVAAKARIDTAAAEFDTQGDAGRIAAEALRLALVTPENGATLFTDGERPVLVHWGLAAPGQTVPGQAPAGTEPAGTPASQPLAGAAVTAGMAGAADAATATPPPAAVRRERRRILPILAWIVPASLAVLLAFLAYEAMTPLPPTVREIIPPPPEGDDPTAGLPVRLAELDTALAEAGAAEPRFGAVCVDLPPEPAPEPVAEVPPEEPATPEPPDEPETEVSLAPEAAPAPRTRPADLVPKPAPPPPAEVPRKPAPARTLKDVIASRDISGIEGCWRQSSAHRSNGRDTGLTDARLCFDANGNGTARYNLDKGLGGRYRCTEPLRAFFRGNRIVMRSGGTQVCTGPGQTRRNSVRSVDGFCQVTGNSSSCRVPDTGVTYNLVR